MNALAAAVGSWMRYASCAVTPDLAWTQERWRVSRTDVEQMAAVCDDCPVAAQCREFVAATGPTAGFWAGAFRERWQVDTTVPLFLADTVIEAADLSETADVTDAVDVPDVPDVPDVSEVSEVSEVAEVVGRDTEPIVGAATNAAEAATNAAELDALDAVRRARRRDLAVLRRRERAERHRQARIEAQQRLREELEAMPVAGLRRVGGGRR